MEVKYRIALLEKYFTIWRIRIRDRKERVEMMKTRLEQRQKLDNLLKALRKHQKEQENEEIIAKTVKIPPKAPIKTDTYKKQCIAQKSTIEKLTSILEEKERLIEELKVGILHKDALNTIDASKTEIREIFADCSVQVRCKMAPPLDYNQQFMLTTQKAPKIMQQMEQRALERAEKRVVIQERKRAMEEKRQRMVEEAVERKRVQDEDEKKRNLEMIKERRKKELELEKIRQANKLAYLEKLHKAVEAYNNRLLNRGFQSFWKNLTDCRNQVIKSYTHFRFSVLKNALTTWRRYVEDLYRDKYRIADALFAQNTYKRMFYVWKEFRLDAIRSMQVAEDYDDLRLQNWTFLHWNRYICTQMIIRDKKMQLAEKHYNRRIIVQFFYQWRSLPAVLQLEKAKEQKLQKWRQKVWEILPNYKPPVND